MKKLLTFICCALMILLTVNSILAAPVETLPTNCLMDVKECWDGSSVSRNPNLGCAFNECPAQPQQVATPVIEKSQLGIEEVTPIQKKNTLMESVMSMFDKKENAVTGLAVVTTKTETKTTSSIQVKDQNVVINGINSSIKVTGTAQKNIPLIQFALNDLSEENKNLLSSYYKIHTKMNNKDQIVFMKLYMKNNGKWFSFSTTKYMYVENGELKNATSWQFLKVKK